MQHNLPTRLTEVRSLANLSQAELAKKVGVSPSLISLWEKGTRVPSQLQLIDVARNLGVTLDYLLSAEVRPQFHFRAKSSPHPEQTPAIERALLDATQQVHFIDVAFRLANRMPRPCGLWAEFTAFGEIPDLATRIRESLKLNRRVTLSELKQALSEANVFVFNWDMPWYLSGMSYRGPFTVIFINHAHPATRQLFTLAHELGHVFFHLGRKSKGESTTEASNTVVSIASNREPIEKEANAFASEFLLPTSEIERMTNLYGQQLKDPGFLEAVARHYNISRDALFYRLAKVGVFRWTEKSRYFSTDLETRQLPTFRVGDIDAQVDQMFLHIALSLLQKETVTAGKLAQWFFTQRHLVEDYLVKLAERTDMAIPDENNHDEGTPPSG